DRPYLCAFPTRRSSDLAFMTGRLVAFQILRRVKQGTHRTECDVLGTYERLGFRLDGDREGVALELRPFVTRELTTAGLELLGPRSEEHTSELQSRENLV